MPLLPAPGWLRDVPLAHRGLHGDGVPENSLPAFAAARDAGYGVELDVHLTADGVPVVVHDRDLGRLTERAVRIGRLTAGDLATLPLRGSRETIPTLAAALETLGDAPVMVECKQPALRAGALERAVAALMASHTGPWCVAGFNPVTTRWFRRRHPDAIRVLTSGSMEGSRLPGPMRRRLELLADLDAVAPHAVSYELSALPASVTDRWREAGGTLVTWTATDAAELQRAREVADNVIFEGVRP
jgi:glycerophosphoryl diester phosphodiesterase